MKLAKLFLSILDTKTKDIIFISFNSNNFKQFFFETLSIAIIFPLIKVVLGTNLDKEAEFFENLHFFKDFKIPFLAGTLNFEEL